MAYNAYDIPSGPKNLKALFPSLNWNDISEYYVEVQGASATSPIFSLVGCDEDVVISFINYLGRIDSIPLSVTVEHSSKSGSYQRPLKSPLVKSEHGTNRLNVKSNDTYTGRALLSEEMMEWAKEIIDSPAAWMQQKATQGQSADYIPIVISDQKITALKTSERFAYELTVEFTLSHERIILSN